MRFFTGTTALFVERLTLVTFAFFQAGASGTASEPANWPHWRGPADNGSTGQGTYPVKWDATNLLWKTPLPGKGCSTPIVWDKRIFLTAPSNGLDAVLAFDWGGKPLWQSTLGPERAAKLPNFSSSNPSPVTDGEAMFVYFNSGTLAALGLEGKVRWQTNLVTGFGPDNLVWDQGTSPVLTRDYVVIARMNHGESWLAAFDKATGQMRWKVPRNYETPEEDDNSYTTPLLLEHQGKQALLVWGAEHLTAHDTSDGRLLWSCGEFNPKAVANLPPVASPVIAGDIAVVPFGKPGSESRLYGIRLGGTGDVTATHRVWRRDDTGTFVPTPAEYKGRIYLLRDRGGVECLDPATGKTLWQHALPKDSSDYYASSSNYYASPLVAGGMLYAIREDGVVFVARVEGTFEILAENHMGERIIASPAAVSDRLLIRGERHLFCVTRAQR
jgi:outer membrane protein assembly factor BamB